ncbi:unnamed protein product [Rotaria magnacalcarata]|uniref:Uncharacterized protein n=2 Tax=Rotaria magnacalcarata TaxID=392030 RepID=A0A816V7G2_9BILA|nr:unnamed protein product [Rotaria magnacalcarata]CAF2117905.1 unnamed protein product [Rotaria magnacalcarata]
MCGKTKCRVIIFCGITMVIPTYNTWIGIANMGEDVKCPAYAKIGMNLFGSGISQFCLIWFTIWLTYYLRSKGIRDKITETKTRTTDLSTGCVEETTKRKSLRNTLIGM